MASFTNIGVKAVVQNINKFQTNLGAINGAIMGVAASATTFALNAGVQMTKALAGIGVSAVQNAIEFESSFAGVRKTVNTTEEEFQKLQTAFTDLSKTVPVDVNTINEIAELGGQLGVVNEDTEDVTGTLTAFAETIAALGVSTNLTTDQAATELARLANIMGTTSREGDETYSKLGSTIVELGNNFATTESDITNFASRIAGAGKIAGLTEADVFGIGAAFSSVGVQAEAGGTAVQKVLIGINTSILEGGDKLDIFAGTAGMASQDFADLWEEDAGKGFESFVAGLGEMGDDAIGVLDALGLKDQRLIRSFLSLANASDESGTLIGKALESAESAWEDNTALTEEAEKRYATTESQLIILKNTLAAVSGTIGAAFLPVLNELLSSAMPLINDFGKVLPGILENTLVPALKEVGWFMGGLFELMRGNLAVSDVFPPALVPFIEGLITTFSNLWTWLSTNIPSALSTTGSFFTEQLIPAIQTAATWIQENLVPIFATLQSWLEQYIPVAAGILAGVWNDILKPALGALAEVWKNDLQPALEKLWEWLGVNIPPIIESLAELWETVLQPSLQMVGTFISETLIPILGNVVSKIVEALIPVLDTLTLIWQTVLLPALQAVWQFLEENIIPVVTSVAEVIGAVLNLALTALVGLFQTINDYLKENLAPIMEKFGKWLSETFGPAIDGISTALQKVADWFGKIKDAIEKVKLPDWLTPGSPTPFELGLKGISGAMKELTATELPKFATELSMVGQVQSQAAASQMVAAPEVMPSSSVTINMGGNNIGSQLDIATFEARVLSVVTGALP